MNISQLLREPHIRQSAAMHESCISTAESYIPIAESYIPIAESYIPIAESYANEWLVFLAELHTFYMQRGTQNTTKHILSFTYFTVDKKIRLFAMRQTC
jgi:hypothetical protein